MPIRIIRTAKGTDITVDEAPNPWWAPCVGRDIVISVRNQPAQVLHVMADGAVIAECWIPHAVTCGKEKK